MADRMKGNRHICRSWQKGELCKISLLLGILSQGVYKAICDAICDLLSDFCRLYLATRIDMW